MQQNSIVSLGPVIASERVVGSASADTQATYGCVDWYLYQNSPPAPAQNGVLAGPAVASPCSSIIERAAAAAGAAVTAVTQAVSPAEAALAHGVW